jgi:hypothetical protein
VIPALRAANAAVDRIIAEAKPKASYANENDKPRKLMTDATGFIGGLNSHDAPRTVKGETLSEQADRLRGLPGNVKLPPAGEERTRLKFKPVLNNLSERKHSHYFRKCPYDAVDVYRVLDLFAITDQALGKTSVRTFKRPSTRSNAGRKCGRRTRSQPRIFWNS